MSTWPTKICATMVALLTAGMAAAQIRAVTGDRVIASSPTSATAVASPGQARVADKFAAPFVTLAGSRENAVALATALRTGSTATLTYTSIAADGRPTTTTVLIDPQTKAMGWGNVSHSLALAQFALNQQGIANPTGAQLKAALEGGSFTTADGQTVALAGVLQQRADGMGWGRIAQSYGTTMGAVNRGIKAPATAVATTTAVVPKTASNGIAPKVPSAPRVAATRGLTTAAGTATTTGQGAAARGLTTSAGTAAGTGHGVKGLTTAGGATSRANSSGIVSATGSAHGSGNAYGRGVVTASGGGASTAAGPGASRGVSSGVVTGAGNAGHVVNADPGQGSGSGNGHGKGKGG